MMMRSRALGVQSCISTPTQNTTTATQQPAHTSVYTETTISRTRAARSEEEEKERKKSTIIISHISISSRVGVGSLVGDGATAPLFRARSLSSVKPSFPGLG